MRIVTISTSGLGTAKATKTPAKSGCYYALAHGEAGRGRWELRFPLAAREFPCGDDSPQTLPLEGEYRLVPLGRKDREGNEQHMIVPGSGDGATLVLWRLSPGYRGSATYQVEGQAKVIALGREAQGDAGRMGGADCPVLLVTGPCQLRWHRGGRLYGQPSDWTAAYDGAVWSVSPTDECAIEEAAMSW